ncbi:MAG: glycoside hydrolase family 15 protein [Chloroflexota bacterium]|nr:glycoside hydrolase family 15 protein [Chloroflexota bacterium]
MTYLPISDYGLIGNCHGAALVGKNGSIDWCCMPRFDSPSIFAAVLDDKHGGRFTIAPRDEWLSSQRYISDTNVLETRFETADGIAIVTDCMPLFESDTDPSGLTIRHQIVRMVRCASGKSTMEVTYQPMPDYGRAMPSVTKTNEVFVTEWNDQRLELLTPVDLDVKNNGALGVLNLVEGDEVAFVLGYSDSNHPKPPAEDPGNLVMNTAFFDQAFAYDIQCEDGWHEPVVRSALALLAMTYFPSGGIVASPTTSLSVKIGGVQNQDYRYTWIRNASFTVDALNSLGETTVALWVFEWLCRICQTTGEEFQEAYRVDGTPDIHEEELTHLTGYRNSHPVRIGNPLRRLPQHSIYGEVLASAYLLFQSGQSVSEEHWELLQRLANQTVERWTEPVTGMWEDYNKAFHFVHSKVMCWVALDRAIKLGKETGHLDPIPKWEATAEAIKTQVLERGWNEEKQTFVQHYDTDAVDASNLLIPLVGFLSDDDPRVVATVACIQRELQTGAFIYRYGLTETNGSIANDEGASMLCSFWLVRALARQGKSDEARKLFTELLEYGNELGLFSEMIDPATGEALGNFPHAMTHLALILAAREQG